MAKVMKDPLSLCGFLSHRLNKTIKGLMSRGGLGLHFNDFPSGADLRWCWDKDRDTS